LKPQSGTQSGTGVSTPETPKKWHIFVRGETKQESLNQNFSQKQSFF
jgi:hypothetical protein